MRRTLTIVTLMSVAALALVLALAGLGQAQAPEPAAQAPAQAAFGQICTVGGDYTPACDVDHDGDVDAVDAQLVTGNWGSAGTYVAD